jgi:hypothetical protein
MESAEVPINWRMDKDNEVCINNGVLFSYKEEGNDVVCRKMYVTGNHHVSAISQNE